jgi:hypothetical protein
MSLFRPVNLVCPSCKALITMDAVGSVNADRRPDLRQAILENRFQDTTCGKCGHSVRLQPEFNYLDAGRGQWIAALPAPRMPHYLDAEDEAVALFRASYGEGAPAAARVVGETLAVRVTFGWPAVREKLLLRGDGLDDVAIELAKLDLMRRRASAPLKPGVELRVLTLAGDLLQFGWLVTDTEEVLETFAVSRGIHDQVAEAPAAWAKLASQLTDGPFVDMQKLYMGPGRAARDAARAAAAEAEPVEAP